MRQRNDGQGEINALQNQFTAYLLVALRRQKNAYCKKQSCVKEHESVSDCPIDESEIQESIDEAISGSSPLLQLEDAALMQAISGLTPKERYILFGRILGGRSYDDLGKPLGLKYSGVAAAYRRIIAKLRKELR